MGNSTEVTTIPKSYTAYDVADTTARDALTGMEVGQLCRVQSTSYVYRWNGTSWALYITPVQVPLTTVVSDTLKNSYDSTGTVDNATYEKVKEVTITGLPLGLTKIANVRVKWRHNAINGGTAYQTKVYKNEVAFGAEKSSGGATDQSEDEANIDLVVNDRIQVYGKKGDTNFGQITNFRLYFDINVSGFGDLTISTTITGTSTSLTMSNTFNHA